MTATMTLSDALEQYFAGNDFDASTYTEDWARFWVGPLPVIIPNTALRKQALRKHDLHHIVTGYRTDVVGEAEIGAWEVATGCGTNGVAWGLNLTAMALGLLVHPKRVFGAFVRGRRCRNLYPEGDVDMQREVSEVQGALGLSESPTAHAAPSEVGLFVAASLAALLSGIGALVSFPVLAVVGWTSYGLAKLGR